MPFEKPFDKIAGAAPSEKKEFVSGDLKTELETQKRWEANWGRYEKKKTTEEKEMIKFVDEESSRVAGNYGGDASFSFPEKAVHFIPGKFWKSKFGRAEGERGYEEPAFILLKDEDITKLARLSETFHEFLHRKNYEKFTLNKDSGGPLVFSQRRTGLQFLEHDKETKKISAQFFGWAEEAVNEELTSRFIEKAIENPPAGYKEEAALLKQTRKILKEKNPLLEEKEIMIREKSKGRFPLFRKGASVRYRATYYPERKKLWETIDEIYKKNPEKFEGKDEKEAKEEIFTFFCRAKFAGEILEPMRLIERTCGKGGIRELGKWARGNF